MARFGNIEAYNMETKTRVLKCDVCGKTVEAEDTGYFGGHPFQGWYILEERGGSTMLEELQRKKNWDICSRECLAKFSKQVHIPMPSPFSKCAASEEVEVWGDGSQMTSQQKKLAEDMKELKRTFNECAPNKKQEAPKGRK